MKTRSPSAAFAARARSTSAGSDAAGSSPGQETPRSLAGSLPRPSRSSASGLGLVSRDSSPTDSRLSRSTVTRAPRGAAVAGRSARRRTYRRTDSCLQQGRESRSARCLMRVVIAPDKFAGTLSAPEVAEAIAAGWRTVTADADLVPLPLSDGGPGLLDVVEQALGGQRVPVVATDPLGRPVAAEILVAAAEDGQHDVYVESARAI